MANSDSLLLWVLYLQLALFLGPGAAALISRFSRRKENGPNRATGPLHPAAISGRRMHRQGWAGRRMHVHP